MTSEDHRRVDINAIVGRVDMQGIMGKVDIAPMAQEIIAEVDIGAIVRQSTGSITGDAVDGGRVTAMRLDGFVDRVTDRILFRRKPRNLVVPGYDPARELEEATRVTATRRSARSGTRAARELQGKRAGIASRVDRGRDRLGHRRRDLRRHPARRSRLTEYFVGSGEFDVPRPAAGGHACGASG